MAMSTEARVKEVSTSAHKPSIIVVDDEPDVLGSVHDLLRRDYRI